MAVIRTLRSFLGKSIYPKTVTKAIYDEKGNRLDIIVSELESKIEELSKEVTQLKTNQETNNQEV